MKKKHRDIIVNDKPYAWLVRCFSTLVIFENKKEILELRFNNHIPITPKVVENVINVINEIDFYDKKNDVRTKARLIKVLESGMTEVGIAQFGVSGVMSGLYIERIWSYTDKEFKDYMDWANILINGSYE